MTTKKHKKKAIRARMEKTGESYTTARSNLLEVEVFAPVPPPGFRFMLGSDPLPCDCLQCIAKRVEEADLSWSFDMDRLVLELDGTSYEVDLERCPTSAATLDWIFQVETKGWGKDTVADLITALNLVLRPQATLCSWEHEQGPVDWATTLRARTHRPAA